MNRNVTILTGDPTIAPLAEMCLLTQGMSEIVKWTKAHRPECIPDDLDDNYAKLFPHEMVGVSSDNELLVELAGRKCYDSFGAKAGRKSNAEYIAHTQAGDVPHSSILYHAKMSFFFAGISRRVSHEIIRNYVGSDRDEEGSPSQESTRFTHHYGFFVEPPRYAGRDLMRAHFERSMKDAYYDYLQAVAYEVSEFEAENGRPPTSIDRKRIYEAASSFLPHQAETSFVWTTNPMAIAKFCRERDHDAADLEIRRFARKYKQVCVERWPGLFPQPWMKEGIQ